MTREDTLAKLRERIVAFAASRLSRDMAEDLAQDVMIVLHEKYPQVTDLIELVPLSFQILKFKMLDFQRKSHRRGQYNQESIEDLPLADPHDDPAMLLEKTGHGTAHRLTCAVGTSLPRALPSQVGREHVP